MSGIDPVKLLSAQQDDDDCGYQQGIAACIRALEEAEATGYFGAEYRTDYIVEGIDAFPVDMLRYTCSWPANEHAVNVILACIIADDRHDGYVTPQRVKLTKRHRDPTPQLAEDRWLSKFRWHVVEGSVETVEI